MPVNPQDVLDFPAYRLSCLTERIGGEWKRLAELNLHGGHPPRSWRVSWTPPRGKTNTTQQPFAINFDPPDPSVTPLGNPGLLLRLSWGFHGVPQEQILDYGRGGSVVLHGGTVTVDAKAIFQNPAILPAGGVSLFCGATIVEAADGEAAEYIPTLSVDTGTLAPAAFATIPIPPRAKSFRWRQYLLTGAVPCPISFDEADDAAGALVRYAELPGSRVSQAPLGSYLDNGGEIPIVGTSQFLFVTNDSVAQSVALWVEFQIQL